MRKKLFSLFALIAMASLLGGCKKDNDLPVDGSEHDPSKTVVVQRDKDYDDHITYDGSIAILSKSPVADVEEAAALRFLGGVTSEVTDNTTAVIVEGNPTDFILDINEVLDRGGVVFLYEPKAEDLKQFVNHKYNILPLEEESIDAYDFEKLALVGFTLDGSIYTCDKCPMEAGEAELVEDDQKGDNDSDKTFYLIEDKGHDKIYDTPEYQMLAGIVEFLHDVEESEDSPATRAGGEKLDFGKIYSKDVLVRMYHSFDDHATWNSKSEDIGNHDVTARFSAKFDITHAFDFDEGADFYCVKGQFTAHCGTFCTSPWQPYTGYRAHTAQGDVLRNVSMEAIPVPGNGYSVALARNAMPMNVPKEKKVSETEGFNVKGSANVGGSGDSKTGGKDGASQSQGSKGGVSVDGGYNWSKTVSYTTHEWTVSNASSSGNSVGYTITTDRNDFKSTWNSTVKIGVNAHSMGNIDAVATWVWTVRGTKKDTFNKGIEKIRFEVKNLRTEWVCQIEDLPSSRTRKEQGYYGSSVEIPLLLTDRTEYGTLNIKNDLKDPITNIVIQNQDGKDVFSGDNIIAPGATFTVSLPTKYTYMVYFDAGQKAGQGVRYQYIKSNGKLLSVSKKEVKNQVASVNFGDVKESTKASITLKNNANSTIKFIEVIDITDGKEVMYWSSKNNGVKAGNAKRIFVEPNRKYKVQFVLKREVYVYDAPKSQPQYILLKEAGDNVELESDDDFVKQ